MSTEVLVVGPSARFLSGVSYYTAALVRALRTEGRTASALLLRQLCPALAYPGRERIGQHPADILDFADAAVHEGLDWFWGWRLPRALAFAWRQRPQTLVLQWWTGTTAHTYLLLAALMRLRGARVVVEFHEALDTGEARIPGVRPYVKAMMRLLLTVTDGAIVHSTQDAESIAQVYPALARIPVEVIHHGPFDHVTAEPSVPADVPRFTFFGVLREYKGIDELADAAQQVHAAGLDFTLTVAGEPWQDSTEAITALTEQPFTHTRLGHLSDTELGEVLSHTDVVVLPYRRSSASGPLHTAMSLGLPVVVTAVPALVEASEGYAGVVYAEPGNADSLAAAMQQSIDLIGTTYDDPHSWPATVRRYRDFFTTLRRSRRAHHAAH